MLMELADHEEQLCARYIAWCGGCSATTGMSAWKAFPKHKQQGQDRPSKGLVPAWLPAHVHAGGSTCPYMAA